MQCMNCNMDVTVHQFKAHDCKAELIIDEVSLLSASIVIFAIMNEKRSFTETQHVRIQLTLCKHNVTLQSLERGNPVLIYFKFICFDVWTSCCKC